MIVMKFGGASVKNAEAVRNVARIIQQYRKEQLVIVVSAMDKTTNHLEALAHAARDFKEEDAWSQLKKIQLFHFEICQDLFGDKTPDFQSGIQVYFDRIEQLIRGLFLLGEFPDMIHDAIVSFGELISSTIVHQFLVSSEIESSWIDARKVIKTDSQYSRANVVWDQTQVLAQKYFTTALSEKGICITQGFIGSSLDQKTTTLGREGSDYTASILAYCLDAEKVIVWKDVAGVLNADPKTSPNAQKIEVLTYEEAVEMTYFGASVIHPKTIKPLYNKNISLHVMPFQDTEGSGTVIQRSKTSKKSLNSTVVKKNQAIIHIKSKDFSFLRPEMLYQIFNYVTQTGLNINLTQTSAISLTLCIDYLVEETEEFLALLSSNYQTTKTTHLTLFTHFDSVIPDNELMKDSILFQQLNNKRYVVKPA